ncbi:hypothetical protein, partial [Schnuerera sp.]|uniref:hypothetical protein n=1 Tax=Schnuerera sp. TaxID=2794844 RepID=UPI002CA5C6CD
MQKRIVAFILFLAIITTSTFAYAAPGDIIHTGLKKIYKADSSADVDELLQDILAGADTNKFYREIDNNKYVNIAQEEDKQVEKLGQILNNIGITNPEDIEKYIIDNKDYIDGELNKLTKSMATGFDEIDDKDKGRIEEYQGASNAILLGSTHYSTPEPGTKEKTTKIERLNTPSGATKWMIKIKDEKIPPMAKDTLLGDGVNYNKGNDIYVDVGKYLVLYAVDNNNRIKGYANIKITDDMVKSPKEEAIKLEVGKVEPGSVNAGTIIISELDELPQGATKWQVMVSNIPIDKVYKGDKLDKPIDYNIDSEITVANEDELHNLVEGFRKYIVLVAVDDENKAVGYRIFEIGKDSLSKPPILLKQTIHYEGPVPGDEDGTTRFTKLELEENAEWKYIISNDKPKIPIIHSRIEGTPYNTNENIKIEQGQYLLLLAAMDGKVEGYKIFKLEDGQVKGLTAPKIDDISIKLEKGSKTGTTKVIGLALDTIEDATKWMFKVGKDLPSPMLNNILDGSMDYIPERDIEITVEDQLLILATDDDGRIKAYILFDEISKDMIKDPAAILLAENRNYIGPIKGDEDGTTKFEALSESPSIGNNITWMYVIQDAEPEIPELDSKTMGIEFRAGDNIKAEPEQYLILLAADAGKVKGYAIIKLTEAHIKMPDAFQLEENIHYSTLKKGVAPGTTMIENLSFIGLDDANQWRVKVNREEYKGPIEINSIISQTI